MRKLVGLVLVVGFASTSAFAGTVGFVNPSSPDAADPSILSLAPGTGGSFDVFVDSSVLSSALAVDVIFLADLDGPEGDASSRGLELSGFTFSPEFVSATFLQATSDTTTQVDGAREFKIGGSALDPPFGTGPFALPISLGTLDILAPADLLPGDYPVTVANDREDSGVSVLALGLDQDPLFGSGTVRVTPEPATLALLGIGGLAVLRRRRTS